MASLNDFWNQWNIRFAVMLSFFLQAFLIFFSPLRKKTSNKCIRLFIWLAYLLADWIAIFAIGLITRSQSSKYAPPESKDFLAFWASFLLLHLGGPDTITAFALEDNNLWLRHLFGLIFQVASVLYVHFLTFSQNKLLVPTILIFLVGAGKYGERTQALYLAGSEVIDMTNASKRVGSSTKYKRPQRNRLKKDRANKLVKGEPQNSKQAPVTRSQLLKTMDDSEDFLDINAETAYGAISFELNGAYGELFTKNRVIHTAWGYIFRLASFAFYVSALVLFACRKHGFKSFDVGVTYTLLLGATALDAFALARIIFSDNILEKIVENAQETESLISRLFGAQCISFLDCKKKPPKKSVRIRDTGVVLDILDTPIAHQRWSASIYAYNLLSRCLGQHTRTIGELIFADRRLSTIHNIFHSLSCFFGAMTFHFCSIKRAIRGVHNFRRLGVLDTMVYVSKNPFVTKLWKVIYDELREKSLLSDEFVLAILVGESRGDWVLFETFWENQGNEIERIARKCIDDLEFDQSLVVWHIATEICYNMDNESTNENRVLSKVLSDYMCYLMAKQPEMLSAIPGIRNRLFEDTLKNARLYCSETASNPETEARLVLTCKKILDLDNERESNLHSDPEELVSIHYSDPETETRQELASGNVPDEESEDEPNLIHLASKLARKLKLLKDEEKWNIVSRVWVEMLSYAAIHCGYDAHARMLSKGGELLTFVLGLMEGFGIERRPLSSGVAYLPEFGSGMRNWTKEKEQTFINKIQQMKGRGLIGVRGLTPTVLYEIAEACSVSMYDIVSRVKYRKLFLYCSHGNLMLNPNDPTNEEHGMDIQNRPDI